MNFIQNESAQKLRGGYYTPPDLAKYISEWVLEKKPRSILEPSCGDGVFVAALQDLPDSQASKLTAFELLPEEASKARMRIRASSGLKTTVFASDFLDWAIPGIASKKSLFDAVVGNPPFIRYQYLPADSQEKSQKIFDLLELPFTKHTNAWVPFILAGISLLKPGGRLGMIIPSEILHVAHAQSLRTFLGKTCDRLLIIDPEEIWFEGTLQGAVILLAEKKEKAEGHGDGLGIVRVSGRRFLDEHPSRLFDKTPRINGKTVIAKWTQALLSAGERELIDEVCAHADVHRFKSIAKVDVGIVTGANDFFLVNDEVVEEFGLEKYAHPMFGRSEHCPGIIYDQNQHEANSSKGSPTNFIWFRDVDEKLSRSVLKYIKLGEGQELHARYKCRIRKPWYSVPSVYSTQVGMLKRSHDMPRLIQNKIGAFTTDTAYRITPLNVDSEQLIYGFINSLSALSAELEGRHYGGGVLELVPSEIEKLLVPMPQRIKPDLAALDHLIRNKKILEVLGVQDAKVLGLLGLTDSQQTVLREAWFKLRNRRQRNSPDINLSQ